MGNRLTVCGALLLLSSTILYGQGSDHEHLARGVGPDAHKVLGNGRVVRVQDIPVGKFHDQLEKLPEPARRRALLSMEKMSFHVSDAEMMRVDAGGAIYYECKFKAPPVEAKVADALAAAEESATKVPGEARAAVPIASPPAFNSKLGSQNTLYLDFNGHVISGTAWNTSRGIASWNCRPFDTDGDTNTFSDAEQYIIEDVWARVAEDYANYDINVTTVEPTVWNQYVAHNMITPTTDAGGQQCPHFGSGGIAYVGVFGNATFGYDHSDPTRIYNPSWTAPMGSGTNYANAAEATSHEVGHNMGLNHDGNSGDYYGGHGGTASAPSWGPIMGTGYGRNVSQWSKGEYVAANNTTQDDLAIIAGRVGYKADDAGDTIGTATTMPQVGVDISFTGLVETADNVDVFQMLVGDGIIDVSMQMPRRPTGTWGGNVDAALVLTDGVGSVIASNNPLNAVTGKVSVVVSAGTYYVHVIPVGCGDPLNATPSGYTSYGSVGTYTLSGTVPVLAGAIVLLTPNGAQTLFQGATNAISWTAGFAGGVDVELYKGGVLDTVIATGQTGSSYQWAIPQNQALGTDYKIRVSESADSGNYDESDANFAILAVDLLTPDAGGTMFQNGSAAITWTSSFTNNVDIALYKGGAFDSVIANGVTSAGGSYNWTVANGQTPGLDYKVRVTKAGSPTLFDESTMDFSIVAAELTAPNGGENIYQSDNVTITWNSDFSETVNITLHRGGAQVATIVSGTANDGSYSWSVPGAQTPALNYRVRVAKVGTPSHNDESDADFAIRPPSVGLWTENFDGQGTIPAGWSQQQVSGTAQWAVQSGGMTGGSNPTAANSAPNNMTLYDAATDSDKNKLITHAFDCSAYGGLTMTFEHYMALWSPDQDFLTVFYRTNASAAWVQADQYLTSVAPWTGQTVVIPETGNAMQIAFEGDARYGYGVCIDDVAVTADPVIDPNPPLVVSSNYINVAEGGTSGFLVALSEVPVGSVTVTVSRVSGDTDLSVSAGGTRVFNSGNWSVGQSVTIAAAQDADWTGDTADFACVDVGGGYAEVAVTATELDDDTDPALLLPFAETFDGAGMASTIAGLNGQHAWSGDANAQVKSAVGRSSSIGLEIQEGLAAHAFENGSNRVQITLWQKPVFGDDPDAVDADSSAVFWAGTNGFIRAYSNTTIVTLPVQLVADTWAEFEAVVDYDAGTWALYVDGGAAGLNLGLYSANTNFTALQLANTATAPAYYDDIGVANITATGPGQFLFDSATYNVNENGANVSLSVRRVSGSDGAVAVNYSASNGSADGSDYALTPGTLNWADRESGTKSIVVTISDDSINEGNEDFSVSLNTPSGGATLGSPSSTTVTIVEDDLPPAAPSGLSATAVDRYQINLAWADNSFNESGFVIQRSATAGSGFSAIASASANATSYNDTSVNENTIYYYRVASSNAYGTSAFSAEASDTTPATQNGTLALTSPTFSVSENGSSIGITVSRTGGGNDAVSVNIATSNGTATAGNQYESGSTTLNWADGDTGTKSLVVTINDDGVYNGDVNFSVGLSGVSGGASLGALGTTVTINEDEPIPVGARVISQSPAAASPTTPGITQLTLTFSEAINTSSFSIAADVKSFTGAQGVDLLGTISGHSWANTNTVLSITFSALTNSANHRILIGPDILNGAGWPLDQDQDSILGETEEDTYAANIWISGGGSGIAIWSDLVGADDSEESGWTLGSGWAFGVPSEIPPAGPDQDSDAGTRILAHNLSGFYTANATSFSETPDINATAYTNIQLSFQGWKGVGKGDQLYVDVGSGTSWQRVYSVVGPNGGDNDTSWTPYILNISTNNTAGQTFRLRWGLVDKVSGSSDQTGWQVDAISVTGDGAGGVPALPLVLSHSPTGTVNGAVSALYLHFSQPMDTNSFATGSDIASFTGPGGSISASGFSWVSGSLLRIDFPEQTQSGTYTLVLNPGVLDDWGQALDQDLDGTPNEATQDQYTAAFMIDTSGAVLAPSSLNAVTASSTQIDLSWTDNATNETGFAVERSLTSGSGFSEIDSAAANATNYSDTTVSAGVTYYYRVLATNASSSSVASGEASTTTPKLPATVSLTGLSPTYNNTARAAGATTTPGGLTVSFTYNGAGTAPTNAGSYTVVGTVSDASYQGVATNTLNVAAVGIEVTADDKSKAYGAADPSLSYSITSGQLFGSDSFSGSITRTAGESVGDHPITQGALSAGSNYNLSFVNGALTITKATATVNLTGLSPTYNNTARAAGATTTPGGLTVSFTYNGAGTAPTNAGSYTVVGTVSDASYQGVATNTLNVATAALEVTTDDKSKTVGDGDPALTASVTSGQLFGVDALSGALTRVAGESSGYYAINQGTLTAGSNYSLTFVSGTFTIYTTGGFVDADGDDMDDEWETTHVVDDPDADADSDDVSNHDEFVAGTDPNDDTKYLRILSITIDGSGRPVITWSSAQDGSTPARLYRVQRRDALGSGSWSGIVNDIPSAGGSTGHTDTNAPTASGIYRILPY